MSKEHAKPEVHSFCEEEDNSLLTKWEGVKRAFDEFLLLSTCIIVGFFLLAIVSNALDKSEVTGPVTAFMRKNIFADGKATSSLLAAIAAGIITVSSLTVTLLLLVVQQTAGSLTSQVFDQFLRSKQNQIYFGFFVGLALYALIVLATVSNSFNPVIGATLVLLFTVIALYLLIILIYTTINEMRPAVIIEAIHDHILKARERQGNFIQQTRPQSCCSNQLQVYIIVKRHGYITSINIEKIASCLKEIAGETEVVLEVSIGDYIAFGDKIGYAKVVTGEDGKKIGKAVCASISIENQRNISNDPGDGIQQLEMIAWTSISTAKSNPYPGLLTIRSLRNILCRWNTTPVKETKTLPIVYKDNVPAQLLNTFESLAMVSSESMQHQNFIEVLTTFTTVFPDLKTEDQRRVEDIILRMLSAMGDFVLTRTLDTALMNVIEVLTNASRIETAMAVAAARNKLNLSVGKLNSRATRTQSSG